MDQRWPCNDESRRRVKITARPPVAAWTARRNETTSYVTLAKERAKSKARCGRPPRPPALPLLDGTAFRLRAPPCPAGRRRTWPRGATCRTATIWSGAGAATPPTKQLGSRLPLTTGLGPTFGTGEPNAGLHAGTASGSVTIGRGSVTIGRVLRQRQRAGAASPMLSTHSWMSQSTHTPRRAPSGAEVQSARSTGADAGACQRCPALLRARPSQMDDAHAGYVRQRRNSCGAASIPGWLRTSQENPLYHPGVLTGCAKSVQPATCTSILRGASSWVLTFVTPSAATGCACHPQGRDRWQRWSVPLASAC